MTNATPLSHRQIMVVLLGLMSGMFVAALDQNIVTTALPTIVSDLGGLAQLSWVVTAYLLASTVATPIYGKLGDLYGRKLLFQVAIGIFLVGSVLSGLAGSMSQMVAFRAVQGIGSGGVIVGAQAIIADLVAPAVRGRYQGYIGSVWAFASVVGPLVGGILTEHLSWRWVFYLNLPVSIAALVVSSLVLKLPRRRPSARIDWLGAALLSSGAGGIVLLTTWVTGGRWNPVGLLVALVALGLVVMLFVMVQRRVAEPVLPLRLFESSVFRLACSTAFLVGFATLGAVTFLPLFLQVVDGETPTVSGLKMVPVMTSLVLASFLTGRLLVRRGRYKVFPVVGTALMTCGLLLLSTMEPDTPYPVQALGMAALGMGLGTVNQILMLAGQNSVGEADLGVATSTITFVRQIGASVGVAFFGAMFAARLESTLPEPFGGDAADLTRDQIAALPAELRTDLVTGFAMALQDVYLWATAVMAVGFVATFFIREIPLRTKASAQTARTAASD
ncbi:MDR family MFS transporter [Dactylosporangium fulvum]|uniref:MFS transporter n=1 Tax=Dactylosporangium fulvum TaxID=53359 RepID=A0ABY5VSF6_9ACTN|nr:MDR family MFS transporter [Dactylosporangium fulvum]UWP80079.1 MFS transporter [Dactylosporangium fulvum]